MKSNLFKRLFHMVVGKSHEDLARMTSATNGLERSIERMERVALDDISRSTGIEYHPYSADKIGVALSQVISRYHEAHIRDD